MTHAEKYAKVFRAAADGFITPWVREIQQKQQDQPAMWQRTTAELIRCGTDDPFSHGRVEEAAMYQAYDGVASMFEKMVAAERES